MPSHNPPRPACRTHDGVASSALEVSTATSAHVCRLEFLQPSNVSARTTRRAAPEGALTAAPCERAAWTFADSAADLPSGRAMTRGWRGRQNDRGRRRSPCAAGRRALTATAPSNAELPPAGRWRARSSTPTTGRSTPPRPSPTAGCLTIRHTPGPRTGSRPIRGQGPVKPSGAGAGILTTVHALPRCGLTCVSAGCLQAVQDRAHAHVVGDRPACELAGGQGVHRPRARTSRSALTPSNRCRLINSAEAGRSSGGRKAATRAVHAWQEWRAPKRQQWSNTCNEMPSI